MQHAFDGAKTNQCGSWLTQWKQTPGHTWLADVPATCLTQCLRDQDRAFGNFFAHRARYQRCLARRKKGSKRREKQRLRVARIHARIRNERQAAIHQLTTRLVREFDLIAIEHLNVKALARGMHARAIHDAAFGEIRRQLLYKGDAAGRAILEVSQWFPSSRTCSHCRHVLDELRLDERQWRCPKCGTHHDRDINAARNILDQGMREIAGCDDRNLRVDARCSCFDDHDFIEQVLAKEARNGHRERACQEQASSR